MYSSLDGREASGWMGTRIRMAESPCCLPETITALLIGYVVVVQSTSRIWLFATPLTAAHQASLCLTISRSLPKFMSIALLMPCRHLITWCLLLLCPIFSSTGDLSNGPAVHIRWPKYWSFNFSISIVYWVYTPMQNRRFKKIITPKLQISGPPASLPPWAIKAPKSQSFYQVSWLLPITLSVTDCFH